MAIVGEASVVVRALIDRFNKDLRKGFVAAEKDADKAGESAGTRFGESFADAVQPEIDGVNFGNVNTRADQEGRDTGGRFGNEFAGAVQEVLEGMEYPDVDISVKATVDDDSTKDFISRLSDRLQALDDSALASFRRIREASADAGERSGESFLERWEIKLDQLDNKFFDAVSGLRERAAAGGDASGESFVSRWEGKLDALDARFFEAIRGFRDRAGSEGDASGESFSSRLMSRLDNLDDGALNWIRGVRTKFGNAGEDSGESFNSGLVSRLKYGTSLAGLQIRQMFSSSSPTAAAAGSGAGNSFNDALRTSLANKPIEPPDFGGRLGAKILAVIPLIGVLGGAISALGGGFVALAGTVGQAAGVLGALPGLFIGIIGTVLAGVVAFGGVGDAIKALGEEQAQAGKDALAGARQQEQAARQIEAAQDAVTAARERVAAAAEGIIRANERVVRAEEEVVRAQEQVVLATERVADAQEDLADAGENVIRAQEDLARAFEDTARANEDAARAVADAERDYVEALDEERQAQNDLQQAREDAAESLEDLAFGLRDATLDVDGSLLSLEETRARLAAVANDDTATDRERRQAQLAFDRAQLSYDKAVDRLAETEVANAEAIAAGIEGSDAVIDAQGRIADASDNTADAARRVQDAEEDRVRTQVDGARRIADAQQDVEDATDAVADAQRGVRDALRGVRDAQRGVTDAYRGVAEAQRGVTEAQRDAEKAGVALARAQRDLGRAQRDAAEGTGALSTAAQNAQDALKGLSPQAESFARLIVSLKDEFLGLRAAAGVELFPKLETALKNVVENFFPTLETALTQAGSSLGDFAITMGDLFASPEFQGNFSGFFTGFFEGIDGGVAPAQNLFNTVRNLTGGLFGLAEASLPLISRFTTWIELMSSNFLAKTTGDTSDLTEKLNAAGDVAARIGDLFGAVFGALGNTFSLGRVAGDSFLTSLTNQAEKWEEWTESAEGTERIAGYFDNIIPVVESIGTFVLGLIQLFTRLGENKAVGDTFDAMTTELGSLESVIASFTELGPSLVELLGSVLELLDTVAQSSAFSTFIDALAGMANGLNTLLKIPGVAQFAGVLLTMAAGMKAISFFTKFTGLQFLTATLGKGLFGATATAGLPAFLQGLRGVSTQAGSTAAVLGDKLRSAIVGTISGIGKLKGPLLAAGTALKGFGASVALALGPVGLIILAVVAIGAALVALYKNSETFRDIVDGAIDTIIDGFHDFIAVMTTVGDFINDFIMDVIGFFQHLYDVLVGNSIIPDLVNAIVGFFKNLWDTVAGIVSGLVTAVVGFFTGLYNDGVRLFTDLMNGISAIWEAIKKVFTDAWGVVTKFMTDRWTNLKNNSTAGFNLVKNAIIAVWEAVKRVFTDAWGVVTRFMTDRWTNLRNNSTTGFNLVKNAISAVWETIKKVFSDAWGVITGAFATFWATMKRGVETSFGAVKRAMDTVMGGILAAFDFLRDKTEAIWNSIKSKIETPIRAVVNVVYNKGIRGFWNPIAKIVGQPELPEVKFAKGGYVPGYAPGRDTVRAMLSPGEGVLVPEAVRGISRKMGMSPSKAINALNAQYTNRVTGPSIRGGRSHFAGGGLVEGIGDRFEGVWNGIKGAASSVGGFFVGNLARASKAILDKLIEQVKSFMPKNKLGEVVGALPGKIASSLIAFFQQKDNEAGESGGSPNGSGGLGPRAAAAHQAVRDIFGFRGTIGGYANRNIAGTNTKSKHSLGKAIDVMTYGNMALGQRIADFFIANRGAYGVDNVIFNRRIANARRNWQYGRYTGQNPHLDHPHIDFYRDGGIARATAGGRLSVLAENGRDETVVDTASLNRFVALVRAAVIERDGIPTGGGGTQLVLSEGSVQMTIVNPKAETAEQSLNDRMRALGELGVLQRMLPKT